MNLPKCFFGSKHVIYLGFRLPEEGIIPGKDKLKAVEKAQPPTSVHEIRQFLVQILQDTHQELHTSTEPRWLNRLA